VPVFQKCPSRGSVRVRTAPVSWIGSEVWVSDIFHISSCAVTRSCGQVLGTIFVGDVRCFYAPE